MKTKLITLIASLTIAFTSYGQERSKYLSDEGVFVTNNQIRLVLEKIYEGEKFEAMLDTSLKRNDLISFYLLEKDREIGMLKAESNILRQQVGSVRDQEKAMQDMLDLCEKDKKRVRRNSFLIGGGVSLALVGLAVIVTSIAF